LTPKFIKNIYQVKNAFDGQIAVAISSGVNKQSDSKNMVIRNFNAFWGGMDSLHN
jgi:hypothetical protein